MGLNIQTIKDIRQYLSTELDSLYPEEEIRALTNIIIKTVTGATKLHQLSAPDLMISDNQKQKLIELCKELKTGKPIQYILGETTFYNCTISLNEFTLIPRPETEELVHLIIEENRDFDGAILDIGTGSGCIAIALAHNLRKSRVTGIDISEEAVNIAKQNSILNNVDVSFLPADIFSINPELAGKTDLIVSNPPYVRESEIKFMSANVVDYEPHTALFVPDANPFRYYKAILDLAQNILHPGGKVYFEINEAFGTEMAGLLKSFAYSNISIVKDINGKSRFVKGEKNG